MCGCWKVFCLLALLSLVASSDSLRILGLFPHPAISHFKFFHPIMRCFKILTRKPDKNSASLGVVYKPKRIQKLVFTFI